MKIGLFDILLVCIGVFLVLMVLRLVSVLAWSWWWVTSPLWIPALVLIALFLTDAVLLYIEIRKKSDK